MTFDIDAGPLGGRFWSNMITYCPDAFIVLNDPSMKLQIIENSTDRCLDGLPRHDKNVPNAICESRHCTGL